MTHAGDTQHTRTHAHTHTLTHSHTQVRSVFDEYVRRAQQRPSSLPLFMVRDTSVLRVTLSGLWLHSSFEDILRPPGAGRWETQQRAKSYIVVQIKYVPVLCVHVCACVCVCLRVAPDTRCAVDSLPRCTALLPKKGQCRAATPSLFL